jgi:hypothetical protein
VSRMALLVAAGAIVGVFTGCGDGASTASGSSPAGAAARPAPAPAAPTVRTINIRVLGGKISGDSGRVSVPLGTPIVLSVSSDVADEIHVHGYDRKAKVPAGTTGSVVFTANIAGVFDVELENSKLALVQLQVG